MQYVAPGKSLFRVSPRRGYGDPALHGARQGRAATSRLRHDQRHGGYRLDKRPAHRRGSRKSGRSWAKQYPYAIRRFSFHTRNRLPRYPLRSLRLEEQKCAVNLGRSTRADMSVRSEQVRVTEPAKLVTTSGDVARRAQQRFAFRRVSQQGKRKRGSCVLQGARGIGSTVMDVGECACVRINKAIED